MLGETIVSTEKLELAAENCFGAFPEVSISMSGMALRLARNRMWLDHDKRTAHVEVYSVGQIQIVLSAGFTR
jgi:hypothetical protein